MSDGGRSLCLVHTVAAMFIEILILVAVLKGAIALLLPEPREKCRNCGLFDHQVLQCKGSREAELVTKLAEFDSRR